MFRVGFHPTGGTSLQPEEGQKRHIPFGQQRPAVQHTKTLCLNQSSTSQLLPPPGPALARIHT